MSPIQISDAGLARAHASQTLVKVAIWGGGLSGLGLVALGLLDSQPALLPAGICGLTIGLVATVQHVRDRPASVPILLLASLTCLVLIPTSSPMARAIILPALMLLALVGILSLPSRGARWYASWCGLIGVAAFPWIVPGLGVGDAVAGLTLFLVVALGGWRFISLAGLLLQKEEETHRSLFDRSPVALFEEDFSAVGDRLADLRRSGVASLREYLVTNPEELRELVGMIGLRRANRAALTMTGAETFDQLAAAFAETRREEHELDAYLAQFEAIWEGRREIAVDLDAMTLTGDPIGAVLHWSVPVEGGAVDLSRVTVAISDISPRKAVEERLARALDANEHLLEFEHALALCSRSLLMGQGEEGLEEALATLREAMDADRAYLTVNVDDPEQGLAFQVVRSVSRPEFAVDDWMGRVIPWSKYPMVRDEMMAERPFQHLGTDEPGAGWSRSVLTVPIHTDRRWAGSVGFMDMRRRRPWSREAIRMLEVAAPMLGTFWEREMTRKRLEDLITSKDRFVASVSHELRTPLSAVLGFAEELRANADSFRAEELNDMLELIAGQSREMADMVEDLLVSARVDIGMVTIHPKDVYLRSQTEAVLAGLGSAIDQDIEVVGGRGRVWADPSRTRQIIRNLLTNAVRYGGDHVVVEAVEVADGTVLTVRDDGPGLDPTQWETIFEPYQRAHDVPTQPASIGLGLTVSRQLARLMGGDLTYRTGDDGSVFTLSLPSSGVDASVAPGFVEIGSAGPRRRPAVG